MLSGDMAKAGADPMNVPLFSRLTASVHWGKDLSGNKQPSLSGNPSLRQS